MNLSRVFIGSGANPDFALIIAVKIQINIRPAWQRFQKQQVFLATPQKLFHGLGGEHRLQFQCVSGFAVKGALRLIDDFTADGVDGVVSVNA